MTDLLSIGDFSRMTFLSVRALRHYSRDSVIAEHLDRMTEQLRQTQETVDTFTPLHRGPRVSHGKRTGPEPGDEFAVTTYDGPLIDLDRAYGVVCWPVGAEE